MTASRFGLRFESELTRRTAEIELRHRSELQALTVQNTTLTRRVEDHLREVAQLRERNQELEAEMSKVARIGAREEADFAAGSSDMGGNLCQRKACTKRGLHIGLPRFERCARRAPNANR